LQSARRLNIASLQNIIAYEYLPAFLGEELAPYSGYKADVHPGISHVFQSAAFRYRIGKRGKIAKDEKSTAGKS
jgi:dual oxidase